MNTPAYHIMMGDKVQATYREYGVVTTEWIDSTLGCALLQTKGISFDGGRLQRYFDGQQVYLEQRVKFFTADSAMKYDRREKRMKKADDWDLAIEAMNDTLFQFLQILADAGFSDPKLERMNPHIEEGWKRYRDRQFGTLRKVWWNELGLRATRLYVASSLVHLRELSMDGGMVPFSEHRLNWLYGVIADGLQEYYRYFFAGNERSDERIRQRTGEMHRIMGAAGIEFTDIQTEGIDTICRPADQDDTVASARRERARIRAASQPKPEELPEAYRTLLAETLKGRLPG